jgi:serine/threonine protein kinase
VIGRTVSHYRIVERLGGGGMGIVYRAQDTRLDRSVALKFLPIEWCQDSLFRERFTREARAASTLDHPHICTVFDIDETPEGQLFIAMAFCPGETLKERILRGPMPIDEAIGIAIQIGEALGAAHAGGTIHRDIKPANILITDRDQVKVVDFGLAKLAGEATVTRQGSVIGTPAYMSPEQATGDETDGRSDLWALGAILYEMVTGRRATTSRRFFSPSRPPIQRRSTICDRRFLQKCNASFDAASNANPRNATRGPANWWPISSVSAAIRHPPRS